ncbi:MAG: ABC transporter substrate-binding protein [Proteobacteria bacterium]|nr:ABC transporter substrate-binding protein [Pseudomonadota bacterium]
MSRFRACLGRTALALAALAAAHAPAAADSYTIESPALPVPGRIIEPPALADAAASGALPAVSERIPLEPLVVTNRDGRAPGVHGGDWRMLIRRTKDLKLLVVYGYARLVCYSDKFEIVPDILRKVDVEDGRVFTLHLRRGHRWSDGAPFTVEDFRYYWEDVANNETLSPSGPPKVLLVGDQPPRFEIIDEHTVRYSWSRPNPSFLPALAAAAPLFIYRPAHYLKQFHNRYADAEKVAAMVAAEGKRNWAALHNRKDNMYRFDNPDLPTLQPWVNTTRPPATRFVARRNPYYHRVDTNGRQLPYIDRVILEVVDGKLIPAKTGAGDVDLQARGLYFNNFTFLKAGEKRNDYSVRLWRTVRGSRLALYPNLTVNDPEWRTLMRDVRFRRALSLATDRHEINQVIYYGLGLEGNNTVQPQSPLYREEYRTAWATFDLERANALLDELGLTMRDDRGIRLLPDGRPMNIIVETAGEDTEQTDVLELIHDSWLKAGIKLYSRPSQREVFRNRIFAGETLMAIWFGYENGVPSADMSPGEFAPTDQQGYHWSKWGQYYQTSGQSGEPVDMAPAQRLLELNEAWLAATSREERTAIWREMLDIHADQVFTLGLVSGVPQPVVVNNRLRNVPREGVYNWDPGAQFGMYRPETFWFAPPEDKAPSG